MSNADRTGEIDLQGQRILFVGGRKENICRFKALVKTCNGCLLTHDGGQEESVSRLRKLCRNVDWILFPVDNVSHAAHDAVKSVCRREDRRFCALRSSGMATFRQTLEQLAAGSLPAC